MATLGQFFSDVLSGIGAPASAANLGTLANVSQTEGVNKYYNPFNIEWHPGDNPAWEGIGNFNSVGVQEYGSYAQGVAATDAFLRNNSRWSNFVNALKGGSGANSQLQAAYTWATVKQASPSQATTLLAKDIGTGTPGAPNPQANGVTVPLDAFFATTIASYLNVHDAGYVWTFSGPDASRKWTGTPVPGSSNPVLSYSDSQVLALASSEGWQGGVGGGPGTGSTDTQYDGPGAGVWSGTADLIKALQRTVFDGPWWERVGVGVLGAVVVAIAIYVLLRSDNIGPSPKQIAETAAIA